MQIRPRRLLKQLSQRTGTSWFRGPNLILVRICDEASDQAGEAVREDDDGRGLNYTGQGLRRTGPYFQ